MNRQEQNESQQDQGTNTILNRRNSINTRDTRDRGNNTNREIIQIRMCVLVYRQSPYCPPRNCTQFTI